MKKIFTLVAMTLMAFSAMAEDYKGDMNISVGDGDPTTQEATISVEQTASGNYTLLLKDFSFAGMPLGDITLEDIANSATEEGTVALKTETTVDVALMGLPLSLPISLDATIDKSNVLTAKMSIDVMGAMTVGVDFVSSAENTTYDGELVIDLGGNPNQQDAQMEVMKSNDVYTLTLKDFNFMGIMPFGDITMAGMKNSATEEGTVKLEYEGDLYVELLQMSLPLTLSATIDKADVLKATIEIDLGAIGMGIVPVTFTSTKSTGISAVETEGSDEVVAIYDLQGRKVTNTNKRGVYILRKADGTTSKVYKR